MMSQNAADHRTQREGQQAEGSHGVFWDAGWCRIPGLWLCCFPAFAWSAGVGAVGFMGRRQFGLASQLAFFYKGGSCGLGGPCLLHLSLGHWGCSRLQKQSFCLISPCGFCLPACPLHLWLTWLVSKLVSSFLVLVLGGSAQDFGLFCFYLWASLWPPPYTHHFHWNVF